MPKPAWKHRSPGPSRWLDPFDGVRERRSRGTRSPLDFQSNSRSYLLAALVPWGLFWGGIDLLSKAPLWQKAAGIVLCFAALGVVACFVKWFLKPVDEHALRRQREYHDSMRSKNLFKRDSSKEPRRRESP